MEAYASRDGGCRWTTYRFYVDMQDATDRMSRCLANDEASLILTLPMVHGTTFCSTPLGTHKGINPAFLPVHSLTLRTTPMPPLVTGPDPLPAAGAR